jgi:hypothetical protein
MLISQREKKPIDLKLVKYASQFLDGVKEKTLNVCFTLCCDERRMRIIGCLYAWTIFTSKGGTYRYT